MTLSKENQRLENRLIAIQNKLGEIGAKLDAHMKPEEAKAVKLPPKEPVNEISSGQPYAIKPQQNPESTIKPPVVLPEGKTPSQVIAEEQEERLDMDTTPAPKTPIAGDTDKLEPIPSAPPLKPTSTAPKTPDEPLV
jgi:hypothetical protein